MLTLTAIRQRKQSIGSRRFRRYWILLGDGCVVIIKMSETYRKFRALFTESAEDPFGFQGALPPFARRGGAGDGCRLRVRTGHDESFVRIGRIREYGLTRSLHYCGAWKRAGERGVDVQLLGRRFYGRERRGRAGGSGRGEIGYLQRQPRVLQVLAIRYQ
jgi:hypothetical protein